MAISVQKTIPSSNWYSGSGDTTITLNGITNITAHSKKDMINISIPKSKSTRTGSLSDEFDVQVVDLKRGTDDIKIRGWLEDDSSESAWNKAWKLRAMCSTGGPLTKLTIDNIEYDSTTQESFLEEVSIISAPAGTGSTLDTNKGDDRVRVEIELTFLIGDER